MTTSDEAFCPDDSGYGRGRNPESKDVEDGKKENEEEDEEEEEDDEGLVAAMRECVLVGAGCAGAKTDAGMGK